MMVTSYHILASSSRRQPRWRGPFFLGALMGLGLMTGCHDARQDRVVILTSGDTHGWITPCGCAANQSGGLARREELVRTNRESAEVILLDAGGSAMGTGPYQQLRFESLLRGLAMMGIDGHNIGQTESAFSPEELSEIGKRLGITWLASNLTSQQGTKVAENVLHFNQSHLSVDVAGVIDPKLVEHSQWRASEPVQAVLNAFGDSTADVHVVLAYVDEGELRRLAESLPEVDYIIGGPTGQAMSPTRVGSVTIMSATNKGKFLSRIALAPDTNGFKELHSGVAEVKSTLKESPQQLVNLKSYYAKLAERDFTAAESELVQVLPVDTDGYAIAGSQACATCHQPDDAVWHHSKHSQAWGVLVAKGAEFDPTCQQCHTTGYGQPGGFVNVASSKKRVQVGCENCHGPSQAHVDSPRKKTPFPARQQCVRCHDHENSPLFAFEAFWPKIFHAGSKAHSETPEIDDDEPGNRRQGAEL